MWISNRGHVFCVRGIRLHPTVVFRMCWWKRSDRVIEKHLSGQKVIVPYVEDTNSDILITIKGIEMNFCRDAYGVRLYLPTRLNVLMQNQRHEDRKTSDLSKSDCSVHGRYRQRYLRVRGFNNFVNNVDIEPWSRILCSRHPITSDWRVFECVDEKEATG